jgi:hypothetical protein
LEVVWVSMGGGVYFEIKRLDSICELVPASHTY